MDGSRKRIPDLTYFTAEQRQAIRRGERVSTLFAIEILSDSESHEDVLEKLQDYFDGGGAISLVHRAETTENLRLHLSQPINGF